MDDGENRRTAGRRDYDLTNIVKLSWVSNVPDQSTVDELKELLALAESGDLIGISYAAMLRDDFLSKSVGANLDHRHAAKGVLMDLMFNM